MISKLSPGFNTYFSYKSAFTSLLPWTVKQKVISPWKVIMVYLGVANKCASVHVHTHTHTHKSVRMLRSWSGCWTTEHITSWNTPERERIPAWQECSARYKLSQWWRRWGGTLWHPSVCDEENLWGLVESENVWEGQKQVHRRRHSPGRVSEPALSVQSCRPHSAYSSSHCTFTWSWTEGEDVIHARILLGPTAGSHPGARLPTTHMFSAYCMVPSVWGPCGRGQGITRRTHKSKEGTPARSMSHQCLGFLIHKDSYNTLSTEIIDIMVFYRKFYVTNILIV